MRTHAPVRQGRDGRRRRRATPTRREILGIGPLNDQILSSTQPSTSRRTCDSKHIEARVFWNRYHGNEASNAAHIGQSLLPARYNLNVLDGEMQYIDQFETGHGIVHDLHLGVELPLRTSAGPTSRTQTENHVGLFVHDEVKLGEGSRSSATTAPTTCRTSRRSCSRRAARCSFTRRSSRPSAASSPPRSARRLPRVVPRHSQSSSPSAAARSFAGARPDQPSFKLEARSRSSRPSSGT